MQNDAILDGTRAMAVGKKRAGSLKPGSLTPSAGHSVHTILPSL